MVSLGDDSTRQGGYFFSGEAGQHTDFINDDDELLTDVLSSEDLPRFIPVRTAWVGFLQIVITIICEILVFLIPFVIVKEIQPNLSMAEQQGHSLILIIYLQASVWIILRVFERYLHYAHRSHMRHGYLLFYRKTQVNKRVPSTAFTVGSVVLMVLSGIYMPAMKNPPSSRIWPVMYAQIVVSFECLVAFISLVIYTGRVISFNNRRSLPDVEQEEFTATITQPSVNLPDIGYRDASYMENLLEKQADMIHYLRLHTAHLSKKILRLTRLTHPSGSSMNSIRYS